MTAPRVVLALTAVAFIGFGVAFTFWPGFMAALVEIGLLTPTARVDFAATYGGFELGFGTFLLIALFRPWLEAGLSAGMLALGGFAAVRLGSLVAGNAAVRPAIYVALGLEVVGMLLNLWGLRILRRRARPTA
jgi:uncharacterized protein DUF4345